MKERIGKIDWPGGRVRKAAVTAVIAAGVILLAIRSCSPEDSYKDTGVASYYHGSLKNAPTASGEKYDPRAMTAAHRSLPLGSIVRVTNLENGKSAIVRINDRGPFVDDRIIDLSRRAARQIGMLDDGISRIRIEVLESPES